MEKLRISAAALLFVLLVALATAFLVTMVSGTPPERF